MTGGLRRELNRLPWKSPPSAEEMAAVSQAGVCDTRNSQCDRTHVVHQIQTHSQEAVSSRLLRLVWIFIAKAYAFALQDIVCQVCVWETAEIRPAIASRHWYLQPLTKAFESHREATSCRIPLLCWKYDNR